MPTPRQLNFLDCYELGPEARESAQSAWGVDKVHGVYARVNVWATHIYLIVDIEGGFGVEQYDIDNDEKGVNQPGIEELVEDAIHSGADDSAEFSTFEDALDAVKDCVSGRFHPWSE